MNNQNIFRTHPPIQDGGLPSTSRQFILSLGSQEAAFYFDLFFKYLDEQKELGHGLLSLQIAAEEGYPIYQTAWSLNEDSCVRSNLVSTELVKGLDAMPTLTLKEVIDQLNAVGAPVQWYAYLQMLNDNGYLFTNVIHKGPASLSVFAYRQGKDLVSIALDTVAVEYDMAKQG